MYNLDFIVLEYDSLICCLCTLIYRLYGFFVFADNWNPVCAVTFRLYFFFVFADNWNPESKQWASVSCSLRWLEYEVKLLYNIKKNVIFENVHFHWGWFWHASLVLGMTSGSVRNKLWMFSTNPVISQHWRRKPKNLPPSLQRDP